MADPRHLEAQLRSLEASGASAAPSTTASRRRQPAQFDPGSLAATLAQLNASIVRRGQPDYPRGLDDLADPPPALFVRGTLPDLDAAVAIVGARAATPYGVAMARRLAADLAGLGFAVVSGLARGIDGAAHEGALDRGGATVAVLPGGLDAVTPRHHRSLAERMIEHGAWASEWASGPPPYRGVFLQRNRLIAGLAAVTVVVEAAERSGSLSTAAAARRMNRPVLAVPGDVDRPTSHGCHALLRAGAHLCEGVDDVLAVLRVAQPGMTAEARILAALTPQAAPLEAIAKRAGLAARETLAGLLKLEWSGVVASAPGQRWTRRVRAAG